MKHKLVYTLFMLAVVLVTGSSFRADKPSELAKIMKQMLVFIQQEKAGIEMNKPARQFPYDTRKISKAKVTPGKKQAKEHTQYVAVFFEELGNYYQANDMVERKAMFNTMVNSCVNCHLHECPGPVPVIKKNLFE